MLRLIGWVITIAVLVSLVWQSAANDPFLPRTVSVIVLLIVSVLAGIRLGTDSCTAYINDVQRLNKVVMDQNRELESANAMLLSKVTSQSPEPSESK